MNKKKKIGILGGTFNPIHKGHLHIAKAAYNYGLDEVWILPNSLPPHKKSLGISHYARRDMVICAIKDADFPLKICEIELFSNKLNYTCETLQTLHDMYPDYELYFIIGQDSLESFDTWNQPKIITKLATILVAVRNGCDNTDREDLEYLIKKCRNIYHSDFELIDCTTFDASSSEIRKMLLDCDSQNFNQLQCILTPRTLSYIKEHRLYGKVMDINFTEIEDELKKTLDARRYNHTLGVMYTASNLAFRYDVDVTAARTAGLLHDCGKYMSAEELTAFVNDRNIPISKAEQMAPHLLHAKAGAIIADEKFGIDDEDILNAIKYHTTGRTGMSLLEKIVFIADYIEPNRDFHTKSDNLAEIRREAYEDLDNTIVMILRETLDYLKENNKYIDITTQATYDYYLDVVNNNQKG